MNYPLRYLESFDSIRAPWQSGTNVDADEAHAQAYIETMVSLAFGHDIVIQQSFALDSLAFQNVLRDFKAAYDRVTADGAAGDFWLDKKLPIRLHLYGARTFREAAEGVFRNIGDGNFHSHLYPDLIGGDAYAIADDLREGREPFRLREFLDGDQRGGSFHAVWEWYGRSHENNELKVVSPDPRAQIGLGELLTPILSHTSSLSKSLADQGLLDHPTVARLLGAIQTLDKTSDREVSFRSRSGLYSNSSWGAKGGPSAGELVGDDLPLVQEVISTLYNRTTVDSIGVVGSACYSTPVSNPVSADDRLIAQRLALASATSARGGQRPTRTPARYVSEPSDPPMEIEIKSAAAAAGLFGEQFGPKSSNAVAAFEGILRLRQDPKWQLGIQEISDAYFSGDFDRYAGAVTSHLDVVAQGVGRHLIVRAESGGMSFTIEDPTQGGAILSLALGSWLGFDAQAAEPAASFALGILMPKARIRLAQNASVKRSRRAWAEAVGVPRRQN